jgi:hypothetical protein
VLYVILCDVILLYYIVLYCTVLYCPVLHLAFAINNNNNNNNNNIEYFSIQTTAVDRFKEIRGT